MEMWNTGCTALRLPRSHRVTEWVLGRARISYGPREFLCKCLGGSCRMEELSLDICLATDFEFWGRKPSGISRNLVLMLSFSDVLLKLLVQLVEVGDKVTCACGSKVAFQMDGKVWMITLVGEEGCNA